MKSFFNIQKFFLQLASDIIGDLRGILSDIKDEENILRNEQTFLARVMEGALEHSDIGILRDP